MQALQALRESIVGGLTVKEDGDKLIIGGKPYGKKTPVPLKSKLPVTLGGLWLVATHPSASHAELRALREQHDVGRLPVVTVRKDVVAYLKGQSSGEGILRAAVYVMKREWHARSGRPPQHAAPLTQTSRHIKRTSLCCSCSGRCRFRRRRVPQCRRDTLGRA